MLICFRLGLLGLRMIMLCLLILPILIGGSLGSFRIRLGNFRLLRTGKLRKFKPKRLKFLNIKIMAKKIILLTPIVILE